MARATQKQVHAWILLVMSRQGASMSATEAETQAKLSRAAFASRFPADCFCAASVDHVCATERYWNEARVTQALEAWQKTYLREPLVRPSDAVVIVMLRGCSYRPGPLLTAWLQERGVVPPYPGQLIQSSPAPVAIELGLFGE